MEEFVNADTVAEGLSAYRPESGAVDIPRMVRAMQRAVREALHRHKLAGHPVAAWRNGRVEWIPPEDIPALVETEDEQ